MIEYKYNFLKKIRNKKKETDTTSSNTESNCNLTTKPNSSNCSSLMLSSDINNTIYTLIKITILTSLVKLLKISEEYIILILSISHLIKNKIKRFLIRSFNKLNRSRNKKRNRSNYCKYIVIVHQNCNFRISSKSSFKEILSSTNISDCFSKNINRSSILLHSNHKFSNNINTFNKSLIIREFSNISLSIRNFTIIDIISLSYYFIIELRSNTGENRILFCFTKRKNLSSSSSISNIIILSKELHYFRITPEFGNIFILSIITISKMIIKTIKIFRSHLFLFNTFIIIFTGIKIIFVIRRKINCRFRNNIIFVDAKELFHIFTILNTFKIDIKFCSSNTIYCNSNYGTKYSYHTITANLIIATFTRPNSSFSSFKPMSSR